MKITLSFLCSAICTFVNTVENLTKLLIKQYLLYYFLSIGFCHEFKRKYFHALATLANLKENKTEHENFQIYSEYQSPLKLYMEQS